MSKELFLTNLQKDEVTKFKYLNFKLLSSDAPLNIFRIGGGGGKKAPFTSFSPLISTNTGISPQKFLTVTFNVFDTLV